MGNTTSNNNSNRKHNQKLKGGQPSQLHQFYLSANQRKNSSTLKLIKPQAPQHVIFSTGTNGAVAWSDLLFLNDQVRQLLNEKKKSNGSILIIFAPFRTESASVRVISRFLSQVCTKIRHTHAIIHYVSISTIEFVIVSICFFHNAEIL